MFPGVPLVRCSYNGYFIGPITDNVATVAGNIFAVDKTSIVLTNFTHDGSDSGTEITFQKVVIIKIFERKIISGTFIYAGTLNPDGSYTKTGYPLTNVQGM